MKAKKALSKSTKIESALRKGGKERGKGGEGWEKGKGKGGGKKKRVLIV